MLLLVRLEDLLKNLTGHADNIILVSVEDPLLVGRQLHLISFAIEVVLVGGDVNQALDNVVGVSVH